jgi:hypothetical protein
MAIIGGIMGIETWNAMNEGMYVALQSMIEVIARIIALLAIAGFATYLGGIAWLCFEETRRSITASRTVRRTPPSNTRESRPRVPNRHGRRTLETSPAPMCEASSAARAPF